ncbi:metabotropic glutamate receptor 6-like [Sycon ciliatum]|uniref:metabotropic glutamate receptor 6-like n=1 Tax=Sycon ciliatum TaxID=27933 RepID=UPI0020AA0EBD|eukprot:scpid25605/ scgid8435/ Metabotropic glutamate receptor 7
MEWFTFLSIFAALLCVGHVRLVSSQGSESTSKAMYGPCNTTDSSCNATNFDVILGGLFPLHNVVCERDLSLESLQWVLAMEQAVRTVNQDRIVSSGNTVVRVGYEIRDTCRSGRVALQQVLSFLGMGGSASASCSAGEISSNFVGVVGPFSSSVSIQVTRLLQFFNKPMVSFGSTSPQLSDKGKYPYFLRTLPSDTFLARAIVRAARQRGWTFINIVFTEDAFGRDGTASVVKEAQAAGICVASRTGLREVATYTNAEGLVDYHKAWTTLLDVSPNNNSTVTVLFTQETNTRHFFLYGQKNSTVRDRALAKNITFLGVDSWGDILTAVVDMNRMPLQTALGAASPIPFNKIVASFDAHLTNGTPSEPYDQFNPWLQEAWNQTFQCDVLTDMTCRQSNRLTAQADYVQSSKVAMVYDAVYAFAYALRDILRNTTLCPSAQATCPALRDGKFLLEALQKVRFAGQNSDSFEFNKNGDPLESKYAEKNMVYDASSQRVSFPTVGIYSAVETGRNVSSCVLLRDYLYSDGVCYNVSFSTSTGSTIVWNDGTSNTPVSICSEDCAPGQERRRKKRTEQSDLTCCWQCTDCTGHMFSNETNSDDCLSCAATEKVVSNTASKNVQCRTLPVYMYTITHPLALVVAVQAAITKIAVVAMLVAQCLWWENDQYLPWPVKAVPTAISLVGIFITLVAAQLFVLRPSALICSLHFSLVTGGLTLALAPIIIFVWEWYTTSTDFFHEEFSADSTFYMRNRAATSQGQINSQQVPEIQDDPVDDPIADPTTDGVQQPESKTDSLTDEMRQSLSKLAADATPSPPEGYTLFSWLKSMMVFVLLYGCLLTASMFLKAGDIKDGILPHAERTLTCSDSGPVLFGFGWIVLLLMLLVCVSLIAIKSTKGDDNTFEADLVKTALFSVLICTLCVVACTAVYTSEPIAVIRNGSFSLASCLISLSLIGVVHGPRFYYIYRHRLQLRRKHEEELTEDTVVTMGDMSHSQATPQNSLQTPLSARRLDKAVIAESPLARS